MTPLNYFTSFVWIHKQDRKAVYEDKRTGEKFQSRMQINKHCTQQAENYTGEQQE